MSTRARGKPSTCSAEQEGGGPRRGEIIFLTSVGLREKLKKKGLVEKQKKPWPRAGEVIIAKWTGGERGGFLEPAGKVQKKKNTGSKKQQN